jgi:hypothetical protein
MNDREPIYVISPLTAIEYAEGLVTTQHDHELLAEELCYFAAKAGFAPFAPHIHYTRFLDDKVPEERQIGIECGLAILKRFGRVFVFTRQHPKKLSGGMTAEVASAERLGLIVEYDPPCWVNVNPVPAHPKSVR